MVPSALLNVVSMTKSCSSSNAPTISSSTLTVKPRRMWGAAEVLGQQVC